MKIEWVMGSEISVKCENDDVTLSANKAGLLSLAGQLLELAKAEEGDHIHYDEYNSLNQGSVELIIEKVK
ncbi:MAG: hypothetical protein IKE33_03630 [Erysipelotrichaceae bacterium]|nr:hypothetical protein [Erysipelotrichaceae bacterium]